MRDAPLLSVILPLYNEERCLLGNVRRVTEELERSGDDFELILVDDGSTDETLTPARSLLRGAPRLQLLYHTPNRGKGYAVRRGVMASRGREVLFLDVDLSTPVSELRTLREARARTGAALAVGSRALARSRLLRRQPWPREALGRLGNRVIRWMAPQLSDIRDTQCGFKLFDGVVARQVFEQSRVERWGFDFEVLALARLQGHEIVEVPVSWRHDEHSKVRAWDYARTFCELLSLRARLHLTPGARR